MSTATAKQYVLNQETSKIELHFDKDDYMALSSEEKTQLKRAYLFSRRSGAWVSRSTRNHHNAIYVAEKLGFEDGGKTGERLSYAEEVERKAKRAEARAGRYEGYADNAERRAEGLQSDLKSMRGDNSFFTQPIIAGHAGSESFARRRQRMFDRYHKGFEEYRKSEYFRDRADVARSTANNEQLKDRTYLSNRIEECNREIRAYERAIVRAEETNNEKWLSDLLDKVEYEIDKLAYFENKLDELGGVQYSKDNVKPGDMVKIRNSWKRVVRANVKTVTTLDYGFQLKYPYAEIAELKTV